MVRRASPPDIKRRQQEGAHDQGNDQSPDDDNRKRPLRVRTNRVRSRRRQQAEGGHQHGHHNRPQPADRALSALPPAPSGPGFTAVVMHPMVLPSRQVNL